MQSCAAYMEMYGTLPLRQIQADFHRHLYEFNPKNSAFKPQH